MTQKNQRLRHVRHVHIAEKEREQEHKRLYALIESIAQDVMSCGSTLNHYQGRSLAGVYNSESILNKTDARFSFS